MLPLVLGGIALAAVGYGVKEFCESEGCPWDEEVFSNAIKKGNVFEALHEKKASVYETRFKLLEEDLSKIKKVKDKSLDLSDTELVEEKLECRNLNNEIQIYVDMYNEILCDSNHIMEVYIRRIEKIMQHSLDYKYYSKKDKKLIKKVYKFMKEIQGMFNLKLLDENSAINVDSILALRGYQEIVKKRYEK